MKGDIQEKTPRDFFRSRGSLKIALKYLVAFGLLAVLFHDGVIDFGPLGSLWGRPWVLLGLVAFAWLTMPLVVWRWWLLLHGQGIHISYFDIFRVSYFSAFAAMLLPGAVGGDVTRILLCENIAPNGFLRYSCSVVVDRICGILGLLGVGLLACAVYYRKVFDAGLLRYEVVLITMFLLGGISFLLLIGLIAPRLLRYMRSGRKGGKIGEKLIEAVAALADYAGNRRVLGAAMLISFAAQAKDLVLLKLLDMVMGVGGLSLAGHAVAGTMTFLINTLPLTPQGLGIGEIAYARLAEILAQGSSIAGYTALLLIFRLIMLLTVLPALFFMPKSSRV